MALLNAQDAQDAHDPPTIPGTVHLVDLQGTMSEKHALSGDRDVVLVPAPSADPDDPVGGASEDIVTILDG